MATIRARKQADKSTRYTAIVRIRKGKTVVHQEYKTFRPSKSRMQSSKARRPDPNNSIRHDIDLECN